MERSSTLLEFLPSELFVEVFSYLKDIDTVFAFSQLNHRFQCLLFEYCQFFDFKSISKTQFDLIFQQHNILQLKSLQLPNDDHTPGQIQYFCQYYSLVNFSSQLESLSLLNLKIEKYNKLFDQLQLLTNLNSLTLESVCGEIMSKINLPELKQLVFSSCKNTKWIKDFSQLESIEYTITDCRFCQPRLTWPLTLKRLKIIFEKDEDLELIQKSLTHLSQLITLEIYQKERGNSLTNGQIWEELIHSSLSLLKEFKFYFQFRYQLLSVDENKQIIASFSTPFYVLEKKWFIRCDMYGSYRSLAAIYTIPFAFDRLTIVSNSTKKSISTYSNVDNEISMNNIYSHVKTLILEEKQSNPDNNLRRSQIINLIINDSFNPIDWIHVLTKLRHLELKSRSNLSSEDFRYLLVNTPHLHSLTTDKCILRTVTENWGYTLVCHKLSERIQSLKLYSSTRQSDCLSRNDLKQIIRIFAAKCQHLSLPVQLPSNSISFILQSMSQLRSLHVHTARKYNSSLNMLWLEKEVLQLNNSNCIIINDGFDCYLCSIFASNRLKEHVSLWTFVAFFTISHVESQSTKITSTTCSSSQLLCGGGICYDPTIQYCTELGTIVQCAGICGNQCYNPNTQQCFNGTVCSLNEQLCIVEYDSSNGYTYNSPYYWCYDPLYEVSFNNSLCQHPYRSCNERCLRYNEVCVNNVTVCNVTSVYHNYELEQIQLCNGICFDSAVQQCVDEQVVLCIRDPFTQKCIDRSISYSQFLNTTTLSTSTISTTTKSSVLFRCCSVKQCTINADCCIRDTEWQCFRHSNQDYGSCLNPYIEPICAEGCPIQKQCRNDTDCCKCQCAQITVININGTLVTKKQCLPR